MSKEIPKAKLPYHADITLFEKMLVDLKTTGNEGVNQDTLWANIGAAKENLRSFTLGLGKFLGILDNDSSKVWLTNFGSTLRYMSKEERNRTLALRLPEKYLTMFKWIRDENELRSNDLKRKFIETWGNVLSAAVLDRAIATFLNYGNWLGIMIYQGRGNQAKAIITDFGKQILDSSPNDITNEKKNEDDSKQPKKEPDDSPLPKDAQYPIRIKTSERHFDFDIKSSIDWEVIDALIKSIKKDWEQKHPKSKEDGQ